MSNTNRELKVLSLNVRGLNNNNKRHSVFNWIKCSQYDVCLLQETFCTRSTDGQYQNGWSGEILHSFSNSTHSRGVCIMLSKNLSYNVLSVHSDTNGRLILLNLEINDKAFTIVNVYAPNVVSERISFFKQVSKFINQHAVNKSGLIIGGDYNCVLTEKDRVSGVIDNSSMALGEFLNNFHVFDVWRTLHPNDVEYTYIDPSSNQRNSRIDMLFCSNVLQPQCILCNICQSPSPDHKAIGLSLMLNKNKRGKGYWKLNNSILKQTEFEDGIKHIYEQICGEYEHHVSKGVLWEYFKLRVKQYSIAFSIDQARKFQDECKKIESELDQIDKQLAITPCEVLSAERQIIKAKLDEQYKIKSKGYQIRSRAKYVEEGEQSTKYFLGLEKSRQNHNCICSLTDNHGRTVYSDEEILDVATQFYSELYTNRSSNEQDIDAYFSSVEPENVLSEDMKEKCEGLFTKEECVNAINNMKRNKSPGLDGLSIEFYAKFWPVIGDLMVDVYNESFERGVLPESQRSAVFSLLFKKDDSNDIANYRPISLTNVDYRIMAFVLAHRLQSVIDKIVSQDQTAYVKHRYMGNNIRLVEDVIEYFDSNRKRGLLFMVDFKKAFDSLNWNFMFRALDFFKFGPSFK